MKDLLTFLNGLHAVAEHAVEQENILKLDRKTPPALRKSRLLYHRAWALLQNSVKSMSEAESLLKEEIAGELRPELLNFQNARKVLSRLAKKVREIEVDCAVMVHPGLRTKAEKRLADNGRWKFGHPHLRINKGSAQHQYEVTALLLGLIAKFSGDKVPPKHIDKFIFMFFHVVLGLTMMTEENVKTMRIRLRRSQRAQGKSSEAALQTHPS